MCLLAVAFGLRPDFPLVVAANRDEWLARPAGPMQRLAAAPRVLGGRDELAGGTWLAVNEHGVVAGLTNKPMRGERDPSKRSRGELPLLVTRHTTAEAAAGALATSVQPARYNPCWLLVGDRSRLFYIDVTGAATPLVRELKVGVHVLENRPLTPVSAKATFTTRALADVATWHGDLLVERLHAVLKSHAVPPAVSSAGEEFERPLVTEAACVHAGPYGTRSASIVLVPPDDRELPEVYATLGPPCTTPFRRESALWA